MPNVPREPRSFSESAVIPAAPSRVYRILADYHDGHARILPRPPFLALDVVEGGIGAGTVIRVSLRLFGRVQTYRAMVTEPEPGRTLVETNENGYVTTFIVEPHGAAQSHVTISTRLLARGAVTGALEQWIVARLLRPVYAQELALLAAVAST